MIAVSIFKPTAAELAQLSAPDRSDVENWFPLMLEVGTVREQCNTMAKAIDFVALRNRIPRRTLYKKVTAFGVRGWRGLCAGSRISHGGLAIEIPGTDHDAFARLPGLQRKHVLAWLERVNAVRPEGCGLREAIAMAAEAHGVNPEQLRSWYYRAKEKGWRGLMLHHFGGHSGLDVDVPACDAAEFDRLPAQARQHVLFWLPIVNEVRPAGGGLANAVAAVAATRGLKPDRVARWYAAARSEGWRGLISHRMDGHSGLEISIPETDRAEFERLPRRTRSGVIYWMGIVNAVLHEGGKLSDAIAAAAEAHGITRGRLQDWYYAAKNRGWRGLVGAIGPALEPLGVSIPDSDRAEFEALEDFKREAVEFWLPKVNDVPPGLPAPQAVEDAAKRHGVSPSMLRVRYLAAKSDGWRGLVPRRRFIAPEERSRREIQSAFSRPA